MRFLIGFALGIVSSKYILAHVAVHVLAWSPLALKLALK